jgi:hypothetical protein
MNTLHSTAAVWFALLGAGASAQSTEAARYVNPQGIEVIQARRAPASEERAHGTDKPGVVIKTAPAAAAAGAASMGGKMQVTAQEQRSRDEDRLAILNAELATENKALETKLRILSTPAMQAKLTPDELRRVQETAADHEKNIRSLNAEIGRVKLVR